MVIADIETDLLTYADFEEVASVSRAKSCETLVDSSCRISEQPE